MEFYAPKFVEFPLKVSVTSASGLGSTTVYIKDRASIELMNLMAEQEK
jgi:hypothetical protein